jgi:hypothetical protein
VNTEISQLSDAAAVAILASFPEVRRARGSTVPQLSEDERRALAEEFSVALASGPTSEGELARQTLLLLADDPDKREIIHTMVRNLPSSAQRFDAGLSIAVGTAALVILQTYVHAKRDKDGKWTFEIKKQPTDKTLLKLFLQKLLPFFSSK